MEKNQSRQIIRNKLALLEDKAQKSSIICKKIIALNLDCNSIMLYKALASEVNVDELIEFYLDKKDVYLPKVKGEDIVLIKIDKNTKYESGAFNIKEPIGEEISIDKASIDVCITPLLGFDESLNRLGKGKGYYDRFFAKCKTKRIGVAFEAQKLDAIDADKHDIKLDLVLTEENTYANN